MTAPLYRIGILILGSIVGTVAGGCSRPSAVPGGSPARVGAKVAGAPMQTAADDTSQLKEVPARLTIYVPTPQAKLQRRVVGGKLYNQMPTAPSTYACVVAEKSLPLLLTARAGFPRGARLLGMPEIKEDVMSVNLNNAPFQDDFWHSKTQARAAVYAVVNTALEGYSEQAAYAVRVRLLREGKPVRSLAGVSLNEPLSPRYNLVMSTNEKRHHGR